jgi:hypothetical protein
MRQVLRLIGNRHGATLALVVVIAVVVGFGKLLGGAARTAPGGYDPGAAPAVDTTVEVSTSPIPDDGDIGPTGSPVPPSTSPGATPPQTVALAFAKAWLHHEGVSADDWHKGLSRYITKTLAEKLDGADPASVPANRTTGDGTVVDQESSYVDIAIPLDAGTLSLRLVVTEGHWLVDGVDWQRA